MGLFSRLFIRDPGLRAGISPSTPRKKRFNFRGLVGKLHLWLGLASGIIVFILGVTGSIYVFEQEIKGWVYRDRLEVTPRETPPLPPQVLWDKAQETLGSAYPLQTMEISGRPDRSWIFASSRHGEGAWTFHGEQVHDFRVYLDPYDGSVIHVENTKFEFFNLVFWAHWSLLLSTPIGQPIVGTATLTFVVLLASGLVLWWPRNRAALKARLKVAWKAKWRRLNWDLHSVPGFYAMMLALLIALTGLVWAFHWFEHLTYYVATGGAPHPEYIASASGPAGAGGGSPLDKTVAAMREEHPKFHSMAITVPEGPREAVTAYVRLDAHAKFRYAWLELDRYTAEVLSRETFSDLNRGQKLRTLNYDIHTGSVLGLAGKILAFCASLVCAALPVTGFLIWWGKRRKAPPRPLPPPGRA